METGGGGIWLFKVASLLGEDRKEEKTQQKIQSKDFSYVEKFEHLLTIPLASLSVILVERIQSRTTKSHITADISLKR